MLFKLLLLFIFHISKIYCGIFDSYYVKIYYYLYKIQIYNQNDTVGILVNMLSSVKTQIPFSYNYLDLCEDENPYRPNETFTELLSGTRSQYSNYIFEMNFNATCLSACMKEFSEDDIEIYKWLIDRNYYINFYLDSLRAGRSKTQLHLNKTYTSYILGIPIGFIFNETYYIYNHYNIYIEVNKKDEKFQIVGF